jgi:geranyl diphosphate synthase
MEEFPQLHDVVDQGFDKPANVELVSYYFVSRMGAVFFIVHLFYL